MDTIPLKDFVAVGADERMPWVHTPEIGDPIGYGDKGQGVVRWAIGQQTRVMYPIKCTHCGQDASRRPVQEYVGLVSVLHDRASSESPTWWVTYCVEHFAKARAEGKI